MLFKEFLVVALGGALGSMLRFALSRWVQGIVHDGFPWGIFSVNVIGSFAIGVLWGVLNYHLEVGPLWRAGLLIGVLGGFTTFSSFSLDTIHLLQSGAIAAAFGNILLTVLSCLLATVLGLTLVRALIL